MGDFFRFWWALIALNSRKTLFRARGGKGLCPCQSPSDSGRAWATQCEAAALWARPARFRRVCPLLKRGPDGWRCSVDTGEVRPFWGRAVAWVTGGVGVLYLAGGVGAFAVFHSQGYRGIRVLDTLLPSRWARIDLARSEFFVAKATAALVARDERAMRVSLASAGAAAEHHYEARLALAQINSYLSERSAASHSFQRLMADFPAEASRTAVAFHDALLAWGEFDGLADLALARLARAANEDRTVWLRAAFGGMRGARAPERVLPRNAASLHQLPPPWVQAVTLEARVRDGFLPAGDAWAGLLLTSEQAALWVLIGETMADVLPLMEALDRLVRLRPVVGAFECERLLFRAHAGSGSRLLVLQSFEGMLRLASNPQQRERLLATMVEFPDRAALDRLMPAASSPRTPFTASELGSLWVAAVAAGHDALRELAVRRLQAHYGVELSASFPTEMTSANALLWARTLPLGRETAWALAMRFTVPRAGSVQRPAK